MNFLKKKKEDFRETNILNDKANIIALFGKINDKGRLINFEQTLQDGEEFQEFDLELIWEAQSKFFFIGEGETPFDQACLLRFSNSNELCKFYKSDLLKKLKEDFKKNNNELEVLFIKERILPLPLKFVGTIFKTIGKIIPFSKFKNKEKNDFENLGGINPRPDQYKGLDSSNLEGPLHMINFLSFRGKEGFSDYQKYGLIALRGVLLLGGRLAFLGRVIDETYDHWNQIAIMEYPSVESFKDLVHMPGYSKATFWRAKGLLKTLLIISKPSKK